MLASKMFDIDVPVPPTPPSPVLSASQSCTSGEIPIYLDVSPSTSAIQLSPAVSASSIFPPAGSVGTFGQPVPSNAGTISRRSYSSLRASAKLSTSTFWTPTTASFFAEDCSQDSLCRDDGSVLRLSAYLASAPLNGDGASGRSSIGSMQSALSIELSTASFLSFGHSKRPQTLNDLAHQNTSPLQPNRGSNLIHRADYPEPDVPLSPTSTFLSPVPSVVSEFTAESETFAPSHRNLRAVSAPPVHPYANVLNIAPETYIAELPQPHSYPRARPRSNSNPHIPTTVPSPEHPGPDTPAWLHDLHIELWIDQEGFRAIQPRLFLTSFSPKTGTNPAGDTLDVAEFALRPLQTWHFHYAPLESAPVLRRLTVNGGLDDYITRQAALSLKTNGVYAVESTEDRGRVAWKLEYRVEDRRAPGSGKIIDGEKCFTLLRFVCNPALLSKENGKKVGLLQVVRKSVTPKLQSVLLGPNAGVRPALVPVRSPTPKKPSNPVDPSADDNARLQQHIIAPAVLNAMFPVSGRSVAEEIGLRPPPRGQKRVM